MVKYTEPMVGSEISSEKKFRKFLEFCELTRLIPREK